MFCLRRDDILDVAKHEILLYDKINFLTSTMQFQGFKYDYYIVDSMPKIKKSFKIDLKSLKSTSEESQNIYVKDQDVVVKKQKRIIGSRSLFETARVLKRQSSINRKKHMDTFKSNTSKYRPKLQRIISKIDHEDFTLA